MWKNEIELSLLKSLSNIKRNLTTEILKKSNIVWTPDIIQTGIWFKYIYISNALTQEKWNAHNLSELFQMPTPCFLNTVSEL